ncbi:putative dolichyl-diphosphooligosaccharide--protein glycotransferase [Helianthus anomalus]
MIYWFGGSLDVAAVLDFVDSGKDLIVVAHASASDLIRSIVAECGVDFDEDPSAVVIDHGSYAVSGTEGGHMLIAADDFIKSDVLLGSTKIEVSFCLFYLKNSISVLLFQYIICFLILFHCSLFFLGLSLFLRFAPRPQARPVCLAPLITMVKSINL